VLRIICIVRFVVDDNDEAINCYHIIVHTVQYNNKTTPQRRNYYYILLLFNRIISAVTQECAIIEKIK